MKRFVLFVIFLLSVSMVSAEFSQDDAKDWLRDRITWSQAGIEELSFATIVLGSQSGLSQLNNKKDSLTSSKDVALSALALKHMNRDIDDQLDYLDDSLKAATDFVESEWIIQVVSNVEGSCDITYEGGSHEVTFDETGKIISGGDNSWITFNRLDGFSFDEALETISVECEMVSTPRISIIKKIVNSIYIIEESFSSNVNFEIENGCYALTPNSGCDEEASFYVSWVLNKLGKELTTNNYLRDNVATDLEYALLSDIDETQLAVLISKQDEDGSFNSKVYETSFAVDALENSEYSDEMNEGKEWVESQQNEETGMIGSGIKDTAVSLYLIYGSSVPSGDNNDEGGSGSGDCENDGNCQTGYSCNPNSGQCEVLISDFCNLNRICEIQLSENSQTCSSDCYCGDTFCDATENSIDCSIDCTGEEQVCNNDGFCGTGENEFNCPLDCTSFGDDEPRDNCGDGFCDSNEDDFTCPSDCEAEEEEGRSLWWVWLIIIVLILGGGGYFVFTKLKKGVIKETPSYLKGNPIIPTGRPQPPTSRRSISKRSPRDHALESELDRSIKEAQDLLKKKK